MTLPARSPAEVLTTPVQYIKGVGPQRAELLQRLGLATARDLLFFFPRDYQDLSDVQDVRDLAEGPLVRLRGSVIEIDEQTSSAGRTVLGVLLACGQGNVRLLWFNQPFLRQRFTTGQDLLITGKARRQGLMWEISHPQVQWIETDEQDTSSLLPVYPLTEGLSQAQIRKIVRGVVESFAGMLDEVFSDQHLADHDLLPLRQALPEIHFPANRDSLARARRRFVYQELLILELALAVRRHAQRAVRQAPELHATARIDARIRRLFPFELTPGQRQAIDEVAADMARRHPMNRLLQGDVGSGKTVVALYAMLLAVAHGYQAVLMAPTEVLARQHALTLEEILASGKLRWAVLSGALTKSQRRDVLARAAAGELDVVIGTQAVIQQEVQFARLGLVAIDEQQKFGVRQRATLKQSGPAPHYLVMTATPIPRTVAMTAFGDLDISTIHDCPPGRQSVKTYLADSGQREQWWEFFRGKLREGRQGYVITPLVDGPQELADASLEQAFESLVNGPLEAFRLDLIHGRMDAASKESTMAAFRRGETQVLVATTVVEVGVDVPNATIMTIEAGERFGLTQLHQLRGRISRGTHPGFCCVFAEPTTDDAHRRLQAFVESNDGFRLAEIDFEIRGPGDLLGTRQHGLPPLRIADLVRDADILVEARTDAQRLIEADPGLARPEHERLRRMTLARYGRVLELGDVG